LLLAKIANTKKLLEESAQSSTSSDHASISAKPSQACYGLIVVLCLTGLLASNCHSISVLC